MVTDPFHRRIVLYGGEPGGSEAWQLTTADSILWQPLAATGGPPPSRVRHSAVLAGSSGHMLVFGGGPDTSATSAVTMSLELANAPAWSFAFGDGGIEPRAGHVSIFDSAADQVLVYGGTGVTSEAVWALSLPHGVNAVPDPAATPSGIALAPPWPNPARGRITFAIRGARGVVEVLDVGGRLVRRLEPPDATGRVVWDGRDARGGRVPDGVYLARIAGTGSAATRRFVFVR
jgi:hypothetical protein